MIAVNVENMSLITWRYVDSEGFQKHYYAITVVFVDVSQLHLLLFLLKQDRLLWFVIRLKH